MSDLGDALERLLTGGVGEPSWGELLGAFEAQAGSGRAAARQIGVDEATWRRWKKGTQPREVNRAKFGKAEREWRARQITNQDIKIHTRERGGRKSGRATRDRELKAKNLKLGPDAAGDIRAAYVAGGAEAAAGALLAATGDRFYRRLLGGDADDADASTIDSDYGIAILAS